MICYICEKKIYWAVEYTFFIGSSVIKRYKKRDSHPGFHIECLKDSLGEDFELFFEKIEKDE